MADPDTHVLYGSKGSGSAAVEAALHVTGAPVRLVEAATWVPGPGTDELNRVNPLGQIPTLVLPGGAVLTESAAILIHLGLQAAPGRLLPADPLARAQSIRGLVFIAANCYSAISIIDYPERWTTDASEASKEAVKAGTRARLHAHWSMFASVFEPVSGGKPFLGGERPGALDILASVVSRWGGTRPHLRENAPEFFALLERVDTHPELAPVFARHWG